MAKDFEPGGYRYIEGLFQYSGGVAAMPGFEIERVRLPELLSVDEGFRAIGAYLKAAGRPYQSFCACELRSPKPFDDTGFHDFNRSYIRYLQDWKIADGDDNPVARSNVCPEVDGPAEPAFYAFSYTVPTSGPGADTFVISGSGESKEGSGDYRDRTVRFGEQTPDAMREKAEWVMMQMERRLEALDVGWPQVTNAHVYTVYDFHPFVSDVLVKRGAARGGLSWHFARPPVNTLDFEMDVRHVAVERHLTATD